MPRRYVKHHDSRIHDKNHSLPARLIGRKSADADIEMTRRKAFPAILRLRDRSYGKPIE
jgi:hypothetical protein